MVVLVVLVVVVVCMCRAWMLAYICEYTCVVCKCERACVRAYKNNTQSELSESTLQ